jgi:hypothetical protein
MKINDLKLILKANLGYLFLCFLIVVGTAARDYSVEYFRNKEWSFTTLNRDSERNQMINKDISDLRAKIDAENITIYLFHNGGFFSSGVPYRKKSSAYESNASINSRAYNYDNIALSQVSELIGKLVESPDCFFVKTDDIKASQWKLMLLSNNYKSNYYKRIQFGDKMIGYMRASFSQDVSENVKIEKEIDYYESRISTFLSENIE